MVFDLIINQKIVLISLIGILSLLIMIGGALSLHFQEPPSLKEKQNNDLTNEEILQTAAKVYQAG